MVSIERVSFHEIKSLALIVRKAGLQFYDSNTTTWYGAREDGRIIGIIACEKMKSSALIRTGFVVEGYRGQGIFRKLFNQIIDFAERLDIRVIKAYCKPTTVDFFLKNGFTVFSTIRDITYVIKRKSEKNG